ncbi:MAG: ImmA/IrrE family metallo-endopeptidase [Alphaproteobacteria bacterium]|nr:MAG: ImmA/IrrE family metallo-endopeptidase [Alphaproteobacteria bacterium]
MTKLQDQLSLIKREQSGYPVQTVPIAEKLGLKVYKVSGWNDETSGMIRKDENDGGASGYAIYVNARHGPTRRRFTIAHEIGHFVLHESLIGDGIVEDALWRSRKLSSKIETQANAFAADLLMPWHLIELAKSRGLTEIEELAVAFEVSVEAMSYRLLGAQYYQGQNQKGSNNVQASAR